MHLVAGCELKVGNKAIGHCTSLSVPNITVDMEETTPIDAADGFAEYCPGKSDAGEMSVDGYYDSTDEGQSDLQAALMDKAKRTFALKMPASVGKTWSFDGYVASFERPMEAGGLMKFTANIRLTGKPTIADTAGT